VGAGAVRRPNGLLIETARAAEAASALTAAGLGPVTVAQPDFVFDVDCVVIAELKNRVI
jgi:ATP phosphoribosyltransferase